MKIPSNNQWTQTNNGNKQGVLGDTFNINLQIPGQLKGSKKSVAFLHEDAVTNMTYPLSIVYYAGDYIVVTSDKAYRFSLTSTGGTTISGYPSAAHVNSDAVICYDRMYLSVDTNLSYWDGSSWTNTIETLTTNVPHPMEVFDSQTTYKLAVANGSSVYLIDSSGNKSSVDLILPAQFTITTLRYRNGYLYVGTRNKYGGEARVFIWDGDTANANYEVPVGASWVFSITPYQSTVACITDKGQLLLINGNTAQELASLPVYYETNTKWQDYLGLQLNGKVFNRGMDVVGDSIYINIDGEVDIGECLGMKSGIWIYNPNVGLYHHAQASSDRARTDSSFTVTDSVITTSATHYLKTGDAVVFTNITGLTNISENKTYYATVTDTDKIKLSLSRTALQAGQFVTIGGSVSSETLLYAQNRDQGVRHHTSGAIGRIVNQELVPPLFAGDIMYGALVDDLDGTNKYTLQILTDSYNISRYSTQRVYSDNIEQTWKEYYAFLDGLILDNEKCVLKYLNKSFETRIEMLGSWLDENRIVVLSATNDVTTISEGDEIVLSDGYGRGYTSFITEIDSSSSTYTFTIEDSLGTANKPLTFYTMPTRRVTTITNQNVDNEIIQASLNNVKSSWVSLSGEMRGFETEISHFQLPNGIHKGTQ